jgi:hypothetical protein
MTNPETKSRWEWIERLSLFVGVLLGIIAFYWQLQERAADRKENLISVYSRVENVRDSLYVINLDLLNVGKRTTHVRAVALSRMAHYEGPHTRVRRFEVDSSGHVRERPNGLFLWIFEDSAGALQLEPSSSRRFISRPITSSNMKLIADSGYVAVSTLRNNLVLRIDPEPLYNALLATELVRRSRGLGDPSIQRKLQDKGVR